MIPKMPNRSTAQWRQTLAENFDTPCLAGQFLTTYPGWTVYPETWEYTG